MQLICWVLWSNCVLSKLYSQKKLRFYAVFLFQGSENSSSGIRWPSASDLNTRLRRLVSGYQRVHRRQELKKAAAEKVILVIRQ